MTERLNNNKVFTSMEVIVVVGIIGIFVGITERYKIFNTLHT